MHFVDRGPEPRSLIIIRQRYTQRWVDYYTNHIGNIPNDSRWRDFNDLLSQKFNNNCAYCEENCRGEVDHFKPKSRFPVLVYKWSNWLFSCHVCNNSKSNKWPNRGYVSPTATDKYAKPENIFYFDMKTGEILPKEGITEIRRQKAMNTIIDIGLNGFHQLKKRRSRIEELKFFFNNRSNDISKTDIINFFGSRKKRLSSLAREFLSQL